MILPHSLRVGKQWRVKFNTHTNHNTVVWYSKSDLDFPQVWAALWRSSVVGNQLGIGHFDLVFCTSMFYFILSHFQTYSTGLIYRWLSVNGVLFSLCCGLICWVFNHCHVGVFHGLFSSNFFFIGFLLCQANVWASIWWEAGGPQ